MSSAFSKAAASPASLRRLKRTTSIRRSLARSCYQMRSSRGPTIQVLLYPSDTCSPSARQFRSLSADRTQFALLLDALLRLRTTRFREIRLRTLQFRALLAQLLFDLVQHAGMHLPISLIAQGFLAVL